MHVDPRPRAVPFAHASEAELARILDYYGIAWEYEPRPFPILWNLDGAVVESFTPDFYLPELDLYVELTTLRQSLVRKKNRKLRRLRGLYPDVRIKLFYARDFRALMLKYGRIGLVDSLSGAEGQATPPRPEAAPPAVEPDVTPAPAIVAARAESGERLVEPPERSADAAAEVREVRGADESRPRDGAPGVVARPARTGRGGGDRRRGGRHARAPQASRA